MTDDGIIYTNGDPSISASLWKIEKINTYIRYKDIRTDYDAVQPKFRNTNN
jgi:hypothetical protein